MAELLCKAVSASHSDPVKDQRGCYKIGMIVEIRPDGCIYGTSEGLPTFFKIKIPLVPVDHPLLLKLMDMQKSGETITRRRKCWLQHANIPLAARNKLRDTGELIIKASAAYSGPFDYSWTQIKNYLWDDDAQANFTDDIS
jgi:hypothetical protein